MTRFTITCFCKRQNIKFRSPENYNAEIISRVYCPKCSDRANKDALMIDVDGVYGNEGVYAIFWNTKILETINPDYLSREHWKEDFFGKRKLIFDFISPNARGVYTVRGKHPATQ
ncbi:MAG: hypothetical protein Q7S48_04355 [bacterium]|nr:hypothetical protein [bacterium]